MGARWVSGFAAVLFALAVTLLGGWYFTAAIGLIIFLAQLEFFRLVQAKGNAPAMRTTMFSSQVLVILQQVRPEWTSPAFIVAGSIICFYLLFKPKVATIADIATSILGLFYCALLPSFWIRVRALSFAQGLGEGLWITLLAIGCVIAADVGAYLCGRAFGRTKLSILSPKKTVEGAVAGIAASMTLAVAGAHTLSWPWSWLSGSVLGFLIGLTSLLGDLTESLMKRDAGVKDSGDLIPGHGGILDRGDSYVFTGPLVFYFMECLEWLNAYFSQ